MNKQTKQILRMGFWVLVSAILQALALSSFSVPADIYPSGITGISIWSLYSFR